MTSSNVYLLRQGLHLLGQISDELYTSVETGVTQAGIGGHLRHCLDFYDAFLRGLHQGRIDYDLRERNELVEKDRAIASAKIREAIAQLQQLPTNHSDSQLLVKLEGEQGETASAWSGSSFRRELQFLLSHTVHHYALIAILLRLQGFQPPADFGVAPSTLKYWQVRA